MPTTRAMGALAALLLLATAAPVLAANAATDSAGGLTTDELVARARAHAAADRHGPAAGDYLAALERDPGLLPVVGRELAFQFLWREDSARAAFWFQRWLAGRPEQDDREARRGLALALSWSGDQDGAIAVYRELAAQDPSDADARLGLGRSLVWDNRLGEGYRELRALETAPPPADAGRRESGRFLLAVLDGYDTPWEARADFSHDSDQLDILRLTAKRTFEASPSLLVQAIPSWARYAQDGLPAITAWRFGGGLVAPLAPTWNLHAYGWVDRFRSGDPLPGGADDGPLRWTAPGGDLWLTWIATPRWRWDFGGSAQPVESLPALARETRLTQGSVSCDWRLARRFSFAASGSRGAYSDDNRRWLSTARLVWRHDGRLELAAGPTLTYLDYASSGMGYWSPGWMRNGSFEATAGTRGARWTLRASGRYGWEKERGADTIAVGAWSARCGWRLAPGAMLVAEGGHARSRLSSAGGYGRNFVGLSLRGFF